MAKDFSLISDKQNTYFKNRKICTGSSIPLSGDYVPGDIVIKENPVAGESIGWICVTGGSPGEWTEILGGGGNSQVEIPDKSITEAKLADVITNKINKVSDIGDKTLLQTVNKDNLVSAINEVESELTGSANTLANILTSKKVKSDGSEGLKPLIDKVQLLRPAIIPGVIYDNGDECLDVSGGFKVVNTSGTCTIEKNADKMRLVCRGSKMDTGISTVKKINVTDYSKLKFNISLESPFKGLCIAGLSSNENSTEVNMAEVSITGTGVHEIDVSRLSGEYYVIVKTYYQSHLEASSVIDLFKIWMEV